MNRLEVKDLANVGTVLELTNKEAVILTPSKGFMSIYRKPGMFIGQKVEFTISEVVQPKKSVTRYAAIASGVAAVFLFAFLYFQLFDVNAGVYAYFTLDVNPSIEFAVDEEDKVIEAEPINPDAEVILSGLTLKGLDLKIAVEKVLDASEKHGFLKKDRENMILITAAINDENESKDLNPEEEKKLESLLGDIKKDVTVIKGKNVVAKTMKVDYESWKQAKENNLSMGKYMVYKKVREHGIEIDMNEVKTLSVEEIVKKTRVEIDDRNQLIVTAATPTPSPLVKVEPTVVPATLTPLPSPTVTPSPSPSPTVKPTEKPEPTPVPTPTPLQKGMVGAGDPRISYSYGWNKMSGSNSKLSKIAGSSASFTFFGDGVKWYGAVGNTLGKADIYIDGELDATVDCYTKESFVNNSVVYSISGLPRGTHTIKIVVRSDKNPASNNSYIVIDAFKYQ